MSVPGFLARLSTGIMRARTLIAGTGITITNPDGDAGNPIISSTVTPSAPGGSSGDYQYNNAGAFAGGELKRPSADIVEQKDGANTQRFHIYNTESGGGANFERAVIRFDTGFFGLPTVSIESQNLGTGVPQGVQLKSFGGEATLVSDGVNAIICYPDVTSSGGINFFVNVPGFVGHIFCDQSGAYMETPGGFGVNHMIDVLPDSTKGLIIGNDVSGADFNNQMLTFDTTLAGRRMFIGHRTPGTASLGVAFGFDSTINSTVANLPTGLRKSSLLWVNDALTPAVNAVVVGGGAVFALVCWDGSVWRVVCHATYTRTWTPTDASGAGLSLTASGTYTKIGDMVYAGMTVTFPATVDGSAVKIGGLPFTVDSGSDIWAGLFGFTSVGATHTILALHSTTNVQIFTNAGSTVANSVYSGKTFTATMVYRASA